MTKHNKDTDKIKSPDIRKILINNTKNIYKNNNKNWLQIFEVIAIKNPTINKIAFNTSIIKLNIFNNLSPTQTVWVNPIYNKKEKKKAPDWYK